MAGHKPEVEIIYVVLLIERRFQILKICFYGLPTQQNIDRQWESIVSMGNTI